MYLAECFLRRAAWPSVYTFLQAGLTRSSLLPFPPALRLSQELVKNIDFDFHPTGFFKICSAAQKMLCQLFGLPPATLTRYLQWSLALLDVVLRGIPAASFSWPSVERMRQLSECTMQHLTTGKLPFGAFGFVDGLKLPVGTSGQREVENAQYNGWTCSHYRFQLLSDAPSFFPS